MYQCSCTSWANLPLAIPFGNQTWLTIENAAGFHGKIINNNWGKFQQTVLDYHPPLQLCSGNNGSSLNHLSSLISWVRPLLPRCLLGDFWDVNQWRNHIGSSHWVIQWLIQSKDSVFMNFFSWTGRIFCFKTRSTVIFASLDRRRCGFSPRMGLPAMHSNCYFNGKHVV